MTWLLSWPGLATVGFVCWMLGLMFGVSMMVVAKRADEQEDSILKSLDESGDQGGWPRVF